MVDSLQFVEENGEVCPANWNKGKVFLGPLMKIKLKVRTKERELHSLMHPLSTSILIHGQKFDNILVLALNFVKSA